MTVPILSMREALDRKDYFGGQLSGDSWAKWRVLLIAIAGEPLLPDEVASFTELTGRATAPAEPPREFWGAQGLPRNFGAWRARIASGFGADQRPGGQWLQLYLRCLRRVSGIAGPCGRPKFGHLVARERRGHCCQAG
jgi:hypothetical protein